MGRSVRDRNVQLDVIRIGDKSTVSEQGESFNVNVVMAADLECRGVGGLAVHDQRFGGCVLRQERSGEREKKSDPNAKSKAAMYVHDDHLPALNSETTRIVHR